MLPPETKNVMPVILRRGMVRNRALSGYRRYSLHWSHSGGVGVSQSRMTDPRLTESLGRAVMRNFPSKQPEQKKKTKKQRNKTRKEKENEDFWVHSVVHIAVPA